MAGDATKDILTVPQLAAKMGKSLDWLRKEIWRRPDLQAMFAKVGPTRVLAAARLKEFKAVLFRDS